MALYKYYLLTYLLLLFVVVVVVVVAAAAAYGLRSEGVVWLIGAWYVWWLHRGSNVRGGQWMAAQCAAV